MKKILPFLKWTGIVLVVLIISIFAFVQLAWDKNYDAQLPDISASTDSTVIARGKYLAFGPSHCATCHVPMDKIMEVEKGLQIPLSGGWEEAIPGFGTFRAPNLTPDKETGIGNITDQQLARSIRYMVRHDGSILFPFMTYQQLSDEDLSAIISFLRSQEPVRHQVDRSEYAFLGKALLAFGLLKPEGPKEVPPKAVPVDSTAEYGKYLAKNVCSCRGCHIKFDMNSGKEIGAEFAGGGIFPPSHFSKGFAFISPNLTPHKITGVIANWDETTFVNRFKAGRVFEGSPMPWGAFSRMNESDVKALYQYFQSLEPVDYAVAKTVYQPGEALPQ